MSRQLTGANIYLMESTAVGLDAVNNDQDEEVEALDATLEVDRLQESAKPNMDGTSTHHLRMPDAQSKHPKTDETQLNKNLKLASENVVVAGTLKDYVRLWQQFTQFCTELGFVKSPADIEAFYPKFPEALPRWIAIWIMDKCDDIDVSTGQPKDPSVPRATISMAQKMRAAMTHKFGRDFELGSQPWTKNALVPDHFDGNPSLSVTVSQYMVSLGRRKVRAGEIVTSARAIDETTMKALWMYNGNFSGTTLKPTTRKRQLEHPEEWAGHNVRTMLQLLYIISMLCLLRYDEALRIMWHEMRPEIGMNGIKRLRLELPFRKTHQNGGIAPFVLYENRDRPWMCPIRAFAAWSTLVKSLGIVRQGHVFRKKIANDRISADPYDAMSTDSFVECFRNNLLDICIDPRPYGTHSFRRGGCQYLAMVARWPFRNICTWGGWSPNFDNPGTVFKYLLSWTDTPLLEREDYFNPNRIGSDPCAACGRTCHCS